MNWGTPTERAARRPLASRMVAFRSLLWLRMGVVAVRETYVAISKHTVSIAERITSAVTRSMSSFVVTGVLRRQGGSIRRSDVRITPGSHGHSLADKSERPHRAWQGLTRSRPE